MTISVNGEPRTFADGTTVQALLDELDLAERRVAVAVNREVVPRAEHSDRTLRPDDRVEIVHAVQGG